MRVLSLHRRTVIGLLLFGLVFALWLSWLARHIPDTNEKKPGGLEVLRRVGEVESISATLHSHVFGDTWPTSAFHIPDDHIAPLLNLFNPYTATDYRQEDVTEIGVLKCKLSDGSTSTLRLYSRGKEMLLFGDQDNIYVRDGAWVPEIDQGEEIYHDEPSLLYSHLKALYNSSVKNKPFNGSYYWRLLQSAGKRP